VIVVAFDPGLTGAGSVQDHNGLRAVFDIPTMPIPGAGPQSKVKTKVDARALVKLLRLHCPPGEAVASVVERIGPTGPENQHSIQTQASLIRSLGAIETVLECLGWSPAYAYPQTWKRHFGLIGADLTDTQRKRKALECARRLYPQCADLALAKHHNRAESILIGHWYRSTQS
jgi:crossover junction endodeoxyribonuclease RuvC